MYNTEEKKVKTTKAKIPENPFILVDGSSYLFRAFHALPPLTTSKGQPTGAIFGVVNMLKKLLIEYHPERMAVVFDSKEKNFRHQKYPAYKANRTVMPDDLQKQIEPLFAVIRAMGLPLIVIPGVEADDVIGTLAKHAKEKGKFTLISTGDKDFAQLVDDKTYLINTMSQEIYDRARVIEKFELPPEGILDYFALIGDSVDNIPGVPKVGPKTAIKWLETYKTLDNIMQRSEEFPGKVGENLRATLDQLPLFKELVTIDVNVPLETEWEALSLNSPDNATLKTLYAELEFRSWLKLLENPALTTQKSSSTDKADKTVSHVQSQTAELDVKRQEQPTHYETILTESQFESWLDRLKNATQFVFDTETTSLDYMLAELVGISFAIKSNEAAYLPCAHDYPDAPKQLSRDFVLQKLKPILEDKNILKIGHNLKYDSEVLANYGITLQGIAFDTMLESYILDASGSRHDMDTLAKRHLDHTTITYEDVAGKGAKQICFDKVTIEAATAYASDDADTTLKLHEHFWPKMQKIPSLCKVFQTVEIPLVSVLVAMERRGVLIDAALLGQQSEELQQKITILEKEIYTLAGEEFNVNSPKQLQEILYNRLNLPILEKTPTGQPSTAEPVMQELAEKYPLPKLILEYRSLTKLKSTYTDKLPTQINAKTGRVHTSYHQAITSTGRLSSSDPNLQNIPIRTLEGRKIRAAFIADKGYKIVAADYSQIELRIMAHMSQDPGLLLAFSQDKDIHIATASSVFGTPLELVTSEQRRSAKAINFGLIYGMSAFGLAKQLGIERFEADLHIEKYFASFPKVKAFMEQTLKQGKALGYVETLLGRRLYLPELNASNVQRRKAAERAAVNAPMQGTNADIIKLAMIELDKWTRTTEDKVRMIMQVHDELVFEVHESVLEASMKHIKDTLENVFPLSIKLDVGIGAGNNWDEAHE